MNVSHSEIPVEAALKVLANLRTERDVVVTNQGSARLWPRLSQHAGDFNYNPSTMGGAIPLGLGIALACPKRHVIVLSGDGSLLMNLGCLVSVLASGVQNLSIVLLDNGLYEVTGGQSTAASQLRTDFAGIARSVGFPTVGSFCSEQAWQQQAAELLARSGPRFIALRLSRMTSNCLDDATQPIAEQLQRLAAFLREP